MSKDCFRQRHAANAAPFANLATSTPIFLSLTLASSHEVTTTRDRVSQQSGLPRASLVRSLFYPGLDMRKEVWHFRLTRALALATPSFLTSSRAQISGFWSSLTYFEPLFWHGCGRTCVTTPPMTQYSYHTGGSLALNWTAAVDLLDTWVSKISQPNPDLSLSESGLKHKETWSVYIHVLKTCQSLDNIDLDRRHKTLSITSSLVVNLLCQGCQPTLTSSWWRLSNFQPTFTRKNKTLERPFITLAPVTHDFLPTNIVKPLLATVSDRTPFFHQVLLELLTLSWSPALASAPAELRHKYLCTSMFWCYDPPSAGFRLGHESKSEKWLSFYHVNGYTEPCITRDFGNVFKAFKVESW